MPCVLASQDARNNLLDRFPALHVMDSTTISLPPELSGGNTVVQMVQLWSRLLAVLLQHWLMLSTAWGQMDLSLTKVCRTICRYISLIALQLDNPTQFIKVLQKIADIRPHTTRRSQRKRPGTFELLNDPWRLEYS